MLRRGARGGGDGSLALGRAFVLLLLAAFASLPLVAWWSAPASPLAAGGRDDAAAAALLLTASAASMRGAGGGAAGGGGAASLSPEAAAAAYAAAAHAYEASLPAIQLVYVVCGNPNEVEEDLFGLLSLKSLLMFKAQQALGGARRRYEVLLLTNIGAEELFNTTRLNHEVFRALRRDARVRVTLRDVSELDVSAARHGVADPKRVPHNIFKNCASSRLKLPFLLADLGIARAIYLDWDTIVLCDLSLLWAEFDRFAAAGAAVGFAQSDPTGVSGLDHYRDWDLPRHPTAGSVNSGVMLVDVAALMRVKADYWAAVEAIIWSRVDLAKVKPDDGNALYWAFTKAFPLGDQDVLNCLLARMPQLLRVLPPE